MKLQGQTLPHSIDAEHSVLGAALLDNSVIGRLSGLLNDDDWYHPQHAALWRSMRSLHAGALPVDVIALAAMGGHELAYLHQISQCVASSRNAMLHAEIIRGHGLRRQVMRAAVSLREACLDTGVKVDDIVGDAVTELLQLLQNSQRNEPRPLSELVGEYLDELALRAEGKTDAITTGLADLDRITAGGGRPGELWVLGARPAMGKSAFVLSLARHVGQQHKVLLLSMEDSLMSATGRHLAAAAGANLADLRQPDRAPESMWPSLLGAADQLAKLQVWMDEQPALKVADVRSKLQHVTAKHGAPALLIVDYLQMMDGDGENRNRELGDIAYALQALGKQTGTWIVLLSQLSREADKRGGLPQMSDLRDSGDIEAAARCICLLHRQWLRKPRDDTKHWAQLHVCKQSNGPTGTVNLYFDGALQRFANWSGPAPAGGDGL